MRRFSRRFAACCLLVIGTIGASAAVAFDRDSLIPVPPANLESTEPAVREQLEGARALLDELLADPAATEADLAQVYGRLGQLYIVYGLIETAESAFRNAEMLAGDDARWPYYLGTIQQETRNLESAVEHYERALEIRPLDLPSRIRLGQVLLEAGELEAAEKQFSRVVELNDLSAVAHAGLAEIAYQRGELERAAASFQAALERQPSASLLHYRIGLVYRDMGDRDRARRSLAERGDVEPRFLDPLIDDLAQLATGAGVYMVRGTTAFTRGRYDIALDAYRKAVAADPENLVARQALASALAQTGSLAEALKQYEIVLEREPDDAVALYNVGTMLAELGHLDEAIDHYRRATALSPDFADAHFNLAAALEDADRPVEAEASYATAVALEPQDVAGRRQWANALSRIGRHEEAVRALETVLAENADDHAARLTLGSVYERLGRNREAAEAYRAVVTGAETPEQRGTAHYQLGNLLQRSGDLDGATQAFGTASRELPERSEIYAALANVLGRQGRYLEAARAFSAVVDLRPEDTQQRFGLILSSLLGEQYAEARNHLDEAIERFPDEVIFRHTLARFLATCPTDELRDGSRALELSRELFRSRQSVEHAETLAMALAESGDFAAAAELQTSLLSEAETAGRTTAAERMRQTLDLYRSERPCRSPWLGGCGS